MHDNGKREREEQVGSGTQEEGKIVEERDGKEGRKEGRCLAVLSRFEN